MAVRFEALISYGLETRLYEIAKRLGLYPGQNAALVEKLVRIGEQHAPPRDDTPALPPPPVPPFGGSRRSQQQCQPSATDGNDADSERTRS